MKKSLFLAVVLLLSACASPVASPETATPQVVSVYASAATQPWLPDLYGCAEQAAVVVRLVVSPAEAEIRLRVGEPENLSSLAYQLGSEELLVVTHRESPVQNLTEEQARALFAQGQAGVQVWVYASGEDVQDVFERQLMNGSGISSLARLAANPQQMADTLNVEKDAVGVLPRHWKVGPARDVFVLPGVPVLALTNDAPNEIVQALLACVQKKNAP